MGASAYCYGGAITIDNSNISSSNANVNGKRGRREGGKREGKKKKKRGRRWIEFAKNSSHFFSGQDWPRKKIYKKNAKNVSAFYPAPKRKKIKS
jgi:hypothetical protein